VTATLAPEEWIEALDYHYLGDFVAKGGATVKFVVCYPDVSLDETVDALLTRAAERGYVCALVDAAATRIHRMEALFGAMCAQLPWRDLTDARLRLMAQAESWEVPETFSDERSVAEQLAEATGLDRHFVAMTMQRRISEEVFRDRRLSRDFRVGMTWLLKARLDGDPAATPVEAVITNWLAGRTRFLSELRPYQIYTKLHRTNARYLLGSLLAWLRGAGRPGFVVAVDASRLVVRQRATDGTVNYSTAALLDAYEVFREFIDATDELDGLLLAVFVPPAFLDLEPYGRGVGRYPALMYRVYDEVRDRTRPNPLSALIRLGSAKEVSGT
jgi:transcriptional regulator with XRE-family HTH domain